MRPCYGPLFLSCAAEARRRRALEKGDHNIGTETSERADNRLNKKMHSCTESRISESHASGTGNGMKIRCPGYHISSQQDRLHFARARIAQSCRLLAYSYTLRGSGPDNVWQALWAFLVLPKAKLITYFQFLSQRETSFFLATRGLIQLVVRSFASLTEHRRCCARRAMRAW